MSSSLINRQSFTVLSASLKKLSLLTNLQLCVSHRFFKAVLVSSIFLWTSTVSGLGQILDIVTLPWHIDFAILMSLLYFFLMSGINLSEEQSFPPTTTVMLSNSESILLSFSVISRMQAPRRQTSVVLGSLFCQCL